MWPDLKEQIAIEESQLERLLAIHQPLLERSGTQAPNAIELSALAALLHSFYTGNGRRSQQSAAGDLR